MLEDGLLSPEILEIAAGLTRDLHSEASAHLYHLADIRRIEKSSTVEEKRFLAASFTPHGELAWRDLDKDATELREAARSVLNSDIWTWTQHGLRCTGGRVRLEFGASGRTTLFSQEVFVPSQFDSETIVHAKRMEENILGLGIAAARAAAAGWGFATLVGVKGMALGEPDHLRFEENSLTVRADIALEGQRADKAMRSLIREVWRAAGEGDSRNFTDEGWKHWNKTFSR